MLLIKSYSSFGVHTVDFGSLGSSCLSMPGDDPGLGFLPGSVEGGRRGFEGDERAILEGLRGAVGDSGGLATGEEGLLPNSTS